MDTESPITTLGRILRDPPQVSVPALTALLQTKSISWARELHRFSTQSPPILGSESRQVVLEACQAASKDLIATLELPMIYRVTAEQAPTPTENNQ